jgi:hypothetical protein
MAVTRWQKAVALHVAQHVGIYAPYPTKLADCRYYKWRDLIMQAMGSNDDKAVTLYKRAAAIPHTGYTSWEHQRLFNNPKFHP